MPLEPHIDAHSHVWTPDVHLYPLAEGFTVPDMQPRSFTAEELLAVCRPAGVGRVNLIQMSYYAFDNAYILDCIRAHPDRFVGTAIVDPLEPDPGRTLAALVPRGIRAVRVQPRYSQLPPARWLEPEGYRSLFAAAARFQVAISCLIDPDGFPEVDRMARAFPETPLVIDHIGRIGVDGNIRDADVEALCALAAHPKMHVKIGAFYALGLKAAPHLDLAPLIRRVVAAFSPKRCLWESDSPFQVQPPHTYADSVALVRDHLDFLSDDDRAWLLARTAETLLFTPR
jgi:predicted TIM-barrel fold metal-dependent hydrolase